MFVFFYALFLVAVLNGITELAKLLKERENGGGYSPVFSTVIELQMQKYG